MPTAEDQWTVGGLYRNYAPSNEILMARLARQSTFPAQPDRSSNTPRALPGSVPGWGPFPHWLYFTPLRKNARLWTRIVIWLSGAATVVALLGLLRGS